MEHTRALLAPTGVLRHIDEDQFRRLLHEETIVVEFEPRAREALARHAWCARQATGRSSMRVFDSLEADGGAGCAPADAACANCGSSFRSRAMRLRTRARKALPTRTRQAARAAVA